MTDRMRILDVRGASDEHIADLFRRSLAQMDAEFERGTRAIVDAVRERGDDAIVEFSAKFDWPDYTKAHIRVTPQEIAAAGTQVPEAWLAAFTRAAQNVLEYHQRIMPQSWIDDFDGITLGQKVTPLESAGAYIPAGAAPLPSTVCMTVMPAQAAGVKRIVVTTPPQKDGGIDPYIAAACQICGVTEVYRIGGAQAIAALAFGTETVRPVVKIVGPGNPWVVLAKKMVFGTVAIESLPGPSESVIIADADAPAHLAAADLLTQAEHTGDNTVILITDDANFAEAVLEEAYTQVEQLSRHELTAKSLANYGAIVVADDLSAAARISNQIAPEHLQLLVQSPEALLAEIENAGCIFLGQYSPVPLGDYAAGPSHVLPTNGTARFSSALSTEDFIKKSSIIKASPEGLKRIGRDVCILAQAEGLSAHACSVEKRLDNRESGDQNGRA